MPGKVPGTGDALAVWQIQQKY